LFATYPSKVLFSTTYQAIAGLINTMRELMRPPEPTKKRPIGFITGEEKTKKGS
jgi:hypothetical protein